MCEVIFFPAVFFLSSTLPYIFNSWVLTVGLGDSCAESKSHCKSASTISVLEWLSVGESLVMRETCAREVEATLTQCLIKVSVYSRPHLKA